MKKSLIAFALLFSFASYANEEAAKQFFMEANKLYSNGNYQQASNTYNLILQEGYFSADLHYNLGNAYYKMDSIPKAILHYEKALRLQPGMDDAQKNLQLANMKTIDKIEPIPDLFLSKWWKSLLNIFHPNTWAKWAVSLMFIAFFGMLAYFFVGLLAIKKAGFYSAIAAVFLSICCWFLAERKHDYLQNSTEAIVMTPTINVYSSPTEGSTKLFVLHKGTKVDLENKKDEWIKIRIPDGNEGWMKSTEVAEI